jgi:hypothetical protein
MAVENAPRERFGYDRNEDGRISFGERVRDMFDGGGRGQLAHDLRAAACSPTLATLLAVPVAGRAVRALDTPTLLATWCRPV